MNKRMSDKRITEIEDFYGETSAGFMSIEVLQALKAERAYAKGQAGMKTAGEVAQKDMDNC